MDDRGLVKLMESAAADLPGGPVVSPVAELLGRARTQRRRRRGGLVAGVALATAAAVIVPIALVRSSGRLDISGPAQPLAPVRSGGTSTSYPIDGPGSPARVAAGHWSQWPAAPIAGRADPASVWTGHEMLVWGGTDATNNSMYADGAAYDPTTRRWTTLPGSPLSGRTGVAAVWTGAEMFLWGGYDVQGAPVDHAVDNGALYNPATRTWHLLPPSPLGPRGDATALWTGQEVVVIGGQPANATSSTTVDADVAAFSPSTGQWRSLPSIPFLSGHAVYAVTPLLVANGIDVWLSYSERLSRNGSRAGIDVDRFDLSTQRWSRVRQAGAAPSGIQDVAWTGREILAPAAQNCPPSFSCAFQISGRGRRFDAGTGRWRSMARSPIDDIGALAAWTGASLLVYDTDVYSESAHSVTHPGAAAVWAPNTNVWTRLPTAPYSGTPRDVASVWTGRQLLMWGEMIPRAAANTNHQHPVAVGLSFGP